MSTNAIFSVESFEESNSYIVRYPDGSCDIMSLEEIKKNFEIPVQGGDGQHKDYESALAHLMDAEDQVPGDFFSKPKVYSSEKTKRTRRQFSVEDSSLI